MNQNENNTGLWLLLCGFAVGVLAGYMHVTSHHKNLASQTPSTQTFMKPTLQGIQGRMNQALKDTTIQSELQRDTTAQDNADSEAISNNDLSADPRNDVIPLVLQQQTNSISAPSYDPSRNNFPPTPGQNIAQMLQQNASVQDYNRRLQREYVRQFLKNAHKHGVDVQLNKNLDVTGLSVNTTNRPLLFPPSSSQSSSRK